MKRNQTSSLWQSRTILLLVAPAVILQVLQSIHSNGKPHLHALGISSFFALTVGILHAATPPASILGGLLTASLIYSTEKAPFHLLSSALVPLFTLFLLTFAATRFGKRKKERLSLAEQGEGRNAGQVAANLGMAALAVLPYWGTQASLGVVAMLGAFVEATADTLSSEMGQVIGGTPRLITSFKSVPAGTDGAISFAGTLAGMVGGAIVALAGAAALHLETKSMLAALAGGVFGLFVDSLLGATLEPKKWLNNNAVNFLSTVAAAGAAVALKQWFL